MSNWIPTVKTVQDNVDSVSGATVNPIITSLATRDQYLFDRLGEYNDKSVLMAYSVPVNQGISTNSVVYYDTEVGGLKLALSSYATSITPEHLIPNKSAFVFGVVKQVYENGSGAITADVYVRGLIPVTLNKILDTNALALGRTTGPLYLSALQAGLLSFSPGGTSVFVGYLLSPTQLFLAPNYDSLNQLFFNYRIDVLDKVNGAEANNGDGTWTITGWDSSIIGWANVAEINANLGADYCPTGAKFHFWIPTQTSAILADPGITDKSEAITNVLMLKEALPPSPAAYTMLFVNGILQHQKTADFPNGVYTIDGKGLWWYDDRTDYKPWSSDGSLVMTLQTVKLNPSYKTSIVSSLKPYKNQSNDSSKFVQFLDAATERAATTGDLLAKLQLPVAASAETTVSPIFVKDITFNQTSGLVLKTGSGITNVLPGPGISVTKDEIGAATVSISNYTLSGAVEDIEPEESDFAYRGLHSYLRIKNPAVNQRIGFVGKLLLPSFLPANKPLRIKLLLFGEETSTNPVKFKFEYAVSKPGAINDFVYKPNNDADIDITGMTKYTAQLLDANNGTPYFEIPATMLTTNSFINFRIARIKSNYAYNVGVIGVYWSIE